MAPEHQLKIRRAEPRDGNTIAHFNVLLCGETEGKELDLDTVQKGVARFIAEPKRGYYFVAEIHGEVIGQTAFTYEWSDWRNGELWWIQSVYVHKEHRGKGVFRQLFNHIKDLGKANEECCGIRLYMERENHSARKSYLKLGFEETGYELFETIF